MVADTTDEQALEHIDVSMFSQAVVAIGTDQEASILTTALLAEAGIEAIWAKALSPQHARILRKVGAHHVVLPEQEMGQRVAHLVDEDVSDYFEITPGWVVVKARPLQEMVGRLLSEVPDKLLGGVVVIAYRPKQADDFQPVEVSTRLSHGDEILVMGSPRKVDRFTARI
jgi:trk system potassium uptake protein TrkA